MICSTQITCLLLGSVNVSSNSQSSNGSFWPNKPGKAKLYWFFRYLIVTILRLLFRIKFAGRENLPKHEAAILAANHASAFDPVFIFGGTRRRITALGNARYFQSKHGWFFRAMGQIPVAPGDGHSRDLALACAQNLLKQGQLVGIFPEGNRSRDGKLYRGHTGVAQLAISTGVPIIPIGVIGSDKVLPRKQKWPKFFQRVEVNFGLPIDPTHYCNSRSLTNQVMKAIGELSDREYNDRYIE